MFTPLHFESQFPFIICGKKLLRETLIETNIRKKLNFTHENWISVVVNKRLHCVVVWVKISLKLDQRFQRVSKLLNPETGVLSAV